MENTKSKEPVPEFDYDKYYKDYWANVFEERKKSKYYEMLYDRIKTSLLPEKDKKIIDVGGGNGQFLNYLGIKKATVFDISNTGLVYAKKLGYYTVKGNVFDLKPLKDESFDIAYCFEVAEHLDYPNLMFAGINRILKSGGVLFLSVPNGKIDGIHHKKRWRLNELIEDLRKSGFEFQWAKNNPKFYPNYNKTYKRSIIFIIISRLLNNKIKFFLSKVMPDKFTSMFIIKVKKVK